MTQGSRVSGTTAVNSATTSTPAASSTQTLNELQRLQQEADQIERGRVIEQMTNWGTSSGAVHATMGTAQADLPRMISSMISMITDAQLRQLFTNAFMQEYNSNQTSRPASTQRSRFLRLFNRVRRNNTQ